MGVELPSKIVGWSDLTFVTDRLTQAVVSDGQPDIVIGLLRGGAIPAVLVTHAIGLRTMRVVDITHTTTDGENAAKTASPTVHNAETIGDLAGLDVLIVDDIAGTGRTVAAAEALVRRAGARRIRTMVCFVNQINWQRAQDHDPREVLTYIGDVHRGWVTFPWEKP